MSVKWGEHSRFSNGRRFVERLFDAQNGFCAACGEEMFLPKRHPHHNYLLYASRDHLVPRKRNGTNCPRNAVAMHVGCNSRKGDRAPTGCELIFHALVLERLHLPPETDVAPHIEIGEQPRATLADIWPKGREAHA
ncbi:MAG: HNH endonuclease [Solirubrobacterales bacterium]|jgi:hypothetical protein